MKRQELAGRSSCSAEKRLIETILTGKYKPGAALPGERQLAAELGIARTTLREVLQRLSRDGWLTVRPGQGAIVNDYWREGNLNTLVSMVQLSEKMTNDFIIHLLEFRAVVIPYLAGEAVRLSPAKMVAFLAGWEEVEDNATAYAAYDWELQNTLAILSRNPIYKLIFNSFAAVYPRLAGYYFEREEMRSASRVFYARLLEAAMQVDPEAAIATARQAMLDSVKLWKKYFT